MTALPGSASQAWWWRADYIESCNCAHGCPCNTSMIPTHGGCQAATAWRIREGACGEVRLDGTTIGLLIHWPGPIHRGNGHAIVFIDENASPTQREALARIGAGKAGEGGPFAIFATTLAEPARVVYGPLRFELDGRRARLRFGELAEVQVGPILNDMDGSEADAHLVLPHGFIFRDAELLNSVRCQVHAAGLSFSHEGSHALFSDVAYNV